MTATGRRERTRVADELCAQAYGDQGGPTTGVALVAVGGYGRGELAPYSDLDVVLVHEEGVDPERIDRLGTRLWYPLWDAGATVDHAVRSLPQMIAQADADVRVAVGLLDVRHVAGDPNLTLRLRTTVLGEWRRGARQRLPELHGLTAKRHQSMGEMGHAAIPDLKESEGGVRDTVVLAALVATWLVDVPPELQRARQHLLDIRDALHQVTGRATDRVAPEVWRPLTEKLGWPDEATTQRRVRELGRRITHLSRLVWRRADGLAAAARGEPGWSARHGGVRRPQMEPIGHGLAISRGEVVLDRGVKPESDPTRLLRAAAEAAERDVVLAPATAARLVREGAVLPDPWPREARQLLVRLLVSGPGLREVWSTLEETGALVSLLPDWERIRLLPHASVIHRFTVDRHVVETCVEASSLIRQVSRPDLLAVAALLHDIGKGGLVEHCVAGAPIARAAAIRMGFEPADCEVISILVRRHLLLAQVASSRDPDDPATAGLVAEHLGCRETLALLRALTEADARATAPQAWTRWRAGLVDSVVARTDALLEAREAGTPVPRFAHPEVAVPSEVVADPTQVSFSLQQVTDGARVIVVSGDRVGLLADVTGVLAHSRVSVRGARAWSQGPFEAQQAVSVWDVAEAYLDPAVLRQQYDAVRAGRLVPADRLRRTLTALAPSVVVRPEASQRATVLEVRAADHPGVLHLVCVALSGLGIGVRSAHVDTLGPQAVDVFYLQEEAAEILSETRAAQAAHTVRAALTR